MPLSRLFNLPLFLALSVLPACSGAPEDATATTESATTSANPIVLVDCGFTWTAPYTWINAPKPTPSAETWLRLSQSYMLRPLAAPTMLGGMRLDESSQALVLNEDYPVSGRAGSTGYVLSSTETATALDVVIKFPDAIGESTLTVHLDLSKGTTVQDRWSTVERRNPKYTMRVNIPGTVRDVAGNSPVPINNFGSRPADLMTNAPRAYLCRAKRQDTNVAW